MIACGLVLIAAALTVTGASSEIVGAFSSVGAPAFLTLAAVVTAPLPRLGYSVPEFCEAVGISTAHYYALKKSGLSPREMSVGSRRIVSFAEAEKWCAERTRANAEAKSSTT